MIEFMLTFGKQIREADTFRNCSKVLRYLYNLSTAQIHVYTISINVYSVLLNECKSTNSFELFD